MKHRDAETLEEIMFKAKSLKKSVGTGQVYGLIEQLLQMVADLAQVQRNGLRPSPNSQTPYDPETPDAPGCLNHHCPGKLKSTDPTNDTATCTNCGSTFTGLQFMKGKL